MLEAGATDVPRELMAHHFGLVCEKHQLDAAAAGRVLGYVHKAFGAMERELGDVNQQFEALQRLIGAAPAGKTERSK